MAPHNIEEKSHKVTLRFEALAEDDANKDEESSAVLLVFDGKEGLRAKEELVSSLQDLVRKTSLLRGDAIEICLYGRVKELRVEARKRKERGC